jgi:ParB-like chromosome segregation protein Spo0J
MEFRKVPVSDIKPAKYNPRKDLKSGDPEYEKLKKSIETFDYIDPIIWNEKTGNIIGGHQRFKVLIDRGEKDLDVVVVNFDEDKEKLANLALNKISGEWDFTLLADLFAEVDANVYDISITGFDKYELENIINWTPGDDGKGEWEGMPDFNSSNELNNKLVVHFQNNEDRKAFGETIKQPITEKTNTIWFPYRAHDKVQDLRY